MAYPLVKPGHFTKIASAASTAFSFEFTSLDFDDEEVESIDITKLSSTTKEFMPAPIYDAGGISGEGHFNPGVRYPTDYTTTNFTNSLDLFTVYYPPNGTDTADTNRERFSCQGFVTSFKHKAAMSPALMTGTIKIKFTGARTYTPQA